MKRQRKRRQLVTASLPKKWSKALPQMRHSCKSDSQTLAETLPSFLGWRKLCSLAHSLSLVSASLTALTQNPAKPRNLKKRDISPSLPSSSPLSLRPNSSVVLYVGLFFFFLVIFFLLLEAGVETYMLSSTRSDQLPLLSLQLCIPLSRYQR